MASSNEKPFTALVAVDDSARGSDVVQAAATVVRALRGTMVLYRGVSIPPDFTPAGVKSEIDLPGYLLQKAQTEMSALRALASDVACIVRVEPITEPWIGILAAADAVDAALIVLGSHGYRGWDRVLGTTAGKVANSSHRNVLVVHDRGDVGK